MTMDLYSTTLALHVVVAVVGIGLIGAIPLVARFARRAGELPSARSSLLDALFRYTRLSLATMALTGGVLDFTVGGAFHSTGWFRVSVGLLLVAAFSHARARAALRKYLASDSAVGPNLWYVERWGWAACATVALMAVLMEAKPF
jgi:hypothetical protein